jgi:hypothetical protein
MEIEVFAKGVEGKDDTRNALWTVEDGAQVLGKAFVGQSAEPLQKVTVALKVS